MTQKISLIIFIFIAISNFCFASIPTEVLKIYDGDTIKVKIDNGNKILRALSL